MANLISPVSRNFSGGGGGANKSVMESLFSSSCKTYGIVSSSNASLTSLMKLEMK